MINRVYADQPERREHMAMTLATMSDETLAATLVGTLLDMLEAGAHDDVLACAVVMVGDIRAGERLRMKDAS